MARALSLERYRSLVGTRLGPSPWVTVSQDLIDRFATCTRDEQFIHVDPEMAAKGPFGGTIAHGYLTLSLVPWLGSMVFSLQTPGAKLNYGVNKVRFPNPVKVGSKLRAHVSVGSVADVPAGHQLTMKYTVEIEGEDKPACVAETVVLLLG